MMKKFSALLLSLVLCLGLIGTSFAAGGITASATTGGVTLSGDLEEGTYLLCSIADKDGAPLVAFNIKLEDFDADGKLNKTVDVALDAGQTINVSIPAKSGGTPITATATVPSGGNGNNGGGGGGGGSISHNVNVSPTRNGSVTVKPTSAAKGEKVTITVKPNEGYVLDTLTVKDANGKEVTLTKVNDTTYTFLMPETSVTVTATFKAAGAAVSFSDVTDPNYTFYADIMWAAEKGYMNGYSDGTFRPNANTTRQALWMVLARIDGANPSDMSAARAWAMSSGVSDGTNPTNPMSRQQMVTMLYRYAQLKGYATTGGVSYTTYPDAANVANYARDAVSWAIGNNILRGTSDGMLNPTGTASRAHFAAFLHRFCTTAGIA